jgi:coenzyme PQQ synthesis protein D (PqqD)
MPQTIAKTNRNGESLLSFRARVSGDIVFRTFVRETVVLNLATGRYHGLNPIAGRMLEELERHPTVGDAARRLAAEYDRPLPEVARDLSDLCSALAERGVVEIDEPSSG